MLEGAEEPPRTTLVAAAAHLLPPWTRSRLVAAALEVVIIRYTNADWANYLLDVSPLPGTVPKVGIRDRDVTVWKSKAPFHGQVHRGR